MTHSVGGFTNAVPDAAVDDGLLHVFIAHKSTWWRTSLAIPVYYSGHLLKSPGMTYFATETLTIEALKTHSSRVDGDPSTQTPSKLTDFADHITVLAPPVGK